MSRRKPFDRKQQLKAILAHAKGVARNGYGLLHINVVTLPKINGPTMEEIEAKYGPIKRITK